MPEEVGSGYIQVSARVDETSYRSVQARFTALTRTRYTATIRAALDNSSVRAVQTRMAALTRTQRKVIRIDVNTRSLDRVGALVNRSIPSNKTVTVGVDVDRDRLNRATSGITQGVGGAFVQGGRDGLIRLPRILGGAMGPVGAAIIGALSGAFISGLPLLGGILVGGLVTAIGLGGIGAAIALTLDDPRIKAGADRLGKTIMGVLKPAAKQVVPALVKGMDDIGKAFKRWGPDFDKLFHGVSKLVDPLVKGVIAFGDGLLPPLARLMDSPIMVKMMETFGKGLGRIGDAIGRFFDKFLNDPEAQQGALRAMEALFDIIVKLIDWGGSFLLLLARTFNAITNFKENVKKTWNSIWEDTKRIWGQIMDFIRGVPGKIASGFNSGMTTIKNAWNTGWEAVKNAASSVWSSITGAVSRGMSSVGNTVSGWMTTIRNTWMNAWTSVSSVVQGALGRIASLMGTGLAIIRNAWNSTWNAISSYVSNVWNIITNAVTGSWNRLSSIVTNGLNTLRNVWNSIWGTFANIVGTIWNNIFGVISGAWTRISNWIGSGLTVLRTTWNNIWNSIATFVGNLWQTLFNTISGAWTRISNWIGSGLTVLRTTWNNIWNSIATFAGNLWQVLYNTISGAWTRISNWIGSGLNILRTTWNNIWNAIATIAGNIWQSIYNTVSGAWNRLSNWIGSGLQVLRNTWNNAWNAIATFVGNTWNNIYNAVKGAWDRTSNYIGQGLAGLRRGWEGAWNAMSTFFSGAWDKIAQTAVSGINKVIDVINKGIHGINKVIEKLGISARIPMIGSVGGPQQSGGRTNGSGTFARGGHVRGPGGETADRIPALLSNNEFVVRAKAAKRIGYHKLNYLNNTGNLPMVPRFGFASGGAVYQQMMAWAKGNLPGVHFASTFRPGDPGYHGRGQAVDMTFSDGSERRGTGQALFAFNKIKGSFFSGIAELIWDFARGQAVWNGKNHFFTGGSAGPGTHNDHIHWAMGALSGKGGGGLLSGALGFLFKPWGEILKEMVQPAINKLTSGMPDTGIGYLMKGAGGFLGKQIIPWIKKQFEEMIASMSFLGGGGAGDAASVASQWGGVGAQALKMLGLPSSWLSPLMNLIARESGGNPRAINNSDSNAARGDPSRGLMQTIGATFSAYRHPSLPNDIYNPLSNIVAGLRYIQSRYGSIFNVQQAVGSTPRGYDTGGILPPGYTSVYNGTGSNEYVYTGEQNDAILAAMQPSGFNGNVNVYVDGVKRDAKTVVDKSNQDLYNAIRRGRKGGR